jgi:hypothetical protein
MKDILFQFYASDIRSTKPLGVVSLEYWINSMKNPKPKFKEIFEKIHLASISNNKAEKDILKRELYFFTPSVIVKDHRRYTNIYKFTGLLTVDFDGLEPDYAEEFKKGLFDEYKCIICAWLSASKKGVRALIKIPIAKNVDDFKLYFNAIEQELGIYNGFDIAPKNCVLPMFMSYDPDILYRTDFTTFTKKYKPIEPTPVVQYFVINDPTIIERIIQSGINKIDANGHPQLRALAFALGGYVASGYIDENNAISLIGNCIDSNKYLARETNGLKMSDVYKKTAKEMIIKGQQKPLYLKNGKV